MTKDWNWHVESLKSRLSELNETVDTIRAAVEERPGLKDATHAISSLISSADSMDQGLSKFPMVVSEILENSVLGAVLIGPAGKFLLHNQTAGEILGYSFILHRSDEALIFEDEAGNTIDSNDLPWNRALLGEAIDDERLHIKTDNQDHGKWITFSATPFTNSDDSVGGVMLFMLDTTEEVGLEESIESICSTISDQIAQVGSTQDQLQELASKLSKTGVQRLLSDRHESATVDEFQREQSRSKKSIARHNEDLETDSFVASSPNSLSPDSAFPITSQPQAEEQEPFYEGASDEAENYSQAEPYDPEPAESDLAELQDNVEDEQEEGFYQEEVEEEEESADEIEADFNQEQEEEQLVEESSDKESLFGKMAQLTTGTTSTYLGQSQDGMEPNLPWPEVVDSEDYGQNLWEEYTQTDETTSSSWEEDEGSEIHNEPKSKEEFESSFEKFEEESRIDNSQQPEQEESEEEIEIVEYIEEQSEETEFASKQLEEEEEEIFENILDEQEVSQMIDADTETENQDETHLESEEISYDDSDDDDERESTIETNFQIVPDDESEFDFSKDEEALDENQYQEEENDEHTIEAQFEEIHEIEKDIEEVQNENADQSRAEVQGGKSLRNTLFGKKREGKKRRSKRPSGTYAAIGGPNELDASYMADEEPAGESLLVSYSSTEEIEEKPVSNKILVVDDIPVNQKLLLLHLKRLGYEADVANNGKEALEAMAKEEYQVVLMDCDMPVMNGFEAATKIRATEAYSHRRVPIIALTSYDRDGDRDKCLAAGMDDYITKGSSRKELKDAIDRSIVSAQEKSKNDSPGTDEEDYEADIEPLDINSMLKLYGKEEVEEISRLFLSNMAAYIECMQLAIDEKDADSVVHFSNAVKGPCAALGMKLMTKLTTEIIEISEKGDWTQVRVKYMRLKAVFVQTQDELKKVCPDDSLMAK